MPDIITARAIAVVSRISRIENHSVRQKADQLYRLHGWWHIVLVLQFGAALLLGVLATEIVTPGPPDPNYSMFVVLLLAVVSWVALKFTLVGWLYRSLGCRYANLAASHPDCVEADRLLQKFLNEEPDS